MEARLVLPVAGPQMSRVVCRLTLVVVGLFPVSVPGSLYCPLIGHRESFFEVFYLGFLQLTTINLAMEIGVVTNCM